MHGSKVVGTIMYSPGAHSGMQQDTVRTLEYEASATLSLVLYATFLSLPLNTVKPMCSS
jgi:hypothetical protein